MSRVLGLVFFSGLLTGLAFLVLRGLWSTLRTRRGAGVFWRLPLFSFAFEHMLGRYRRGDSHLYVSGGTGHWFPFRMGIPAEVTVLTLRAA
ncbi:hypothetical protein ACN28E_45790 [Archangium lansingense]|uniref:hypothetical protein n=1 Tax=Archangium lansingense TaxID=2995310 RepID=UPI003B825FFE